jgi:hypothetical protein
MTLEAATEVASNLLPEDHREVLEGHGHDPVESIPLTVFNCDSISFRMPDGRLAGIAGVYEDGQIWMLCTPVILKYPVTFAREARRYVEQRTEKLLWNIVDERNTVHLKLLRFLGFKFLRRLKYGPNNLSFIEFCKINHGNLGSSRCNSISRDGNHIRQQTIQTSKVS